MGVFQVAGARKSRYNSYSETLKAEVYITTNMNLLGARVVESQAKFAYKGIYVIKEGKTKFHYLDQIADQYVNGKLKRPYTTICGNPIDITQWRGIPSQFIIAEKQICKCCQSRLFSECKTQFLSMCNMIQILSYRFGEKNTHQHLYLDDSSSLVDISKVFSSDEFKFENIMSYLTPYYNSLIKSWSKSKKNTGPKSIRSLKITIPQEDKPISTLDDILDIRYYHYSMKQNL